MKRIIFLLAMLAVAACAHKAPLIGISGSYMPTGGTSLNTNYSQAISKAGAVPVIIPTVSSREEADAVLAVLDGIVFSGGEDLGPWLYGEDIYNETVFVDSVRDVSDVFLAQAALDSRKPILAICRGEQLMNVVLGGSLYQDIPDQIADNVGHGGTTHKIGVEKGSILAGLFGIDSLEVNSTHHQAVKDLAPGLKVTARSHDGIIEAYEGENLTAVQFHPEKLVAAGDDKWIEFFKVFITKCK
ncbi:MAG: gamma-glutamyl-gamma-aminobutyrate hydrolase family protein [Bacteroidales bacterium]|nr:gamma-glutamyl-gamma-aminobutyrate hydrolase family protein [Bacteroidales bacterium]